MNPVVLTGLTLRRITVPFRFSFQHSLATRRAAESWIVAVTAEGGAGDAPATGYGEALPREYLTGETLETVRDDLLAWWNFLRGAAMPPGGDIAPALAFLRPHYLAADARRRTAAWAALDVAVVDAYARACRIAGDRLLGFGNHAGTEPTGTGERLWRLTGPIGGGGARRAGWVTRGLRWLGFRDFKVKTGHGDDEKRLAAARRVLGPDLPLRADANAGWTPEDLDAAGTMLRRHGVASVEQPVAAGDAVALAKAGERLGLPVMADESLCTLADAEALLAAGAAPLWNVRLGKNGGFSGVLELLKRGETAGIKGHLGVLVGETAVLAAAQRACAGWADWAHVEYGFPDWLLGARPFRGAPDGCRGRGSLRRLARAYGLGVEPNPGVLDRVTRETLTA